MENRYKNRERNNILKLADSIHKETRLCVIECSVYLEEIVSATLANFLNLDWKKSESLGYGSSSLGFDNKIRLIQDIKGVEKQDKEKFQSIMALRNKFAHIAEIDTFENYFKHVKSAKDQQTKFQKWFPHLKQELTDIENHTSTLFIF